MGANMLGAVLGGWAEYATMAVGIRALLLLALGFYAASALSLWLATRRARVADTRPIVEIDAESEPEPGLRG